MSTISPQLAFTLETIIISAFFAIIAAAIILMCAVRREFRGQMLKFTSYKYFAWLFLIMMCILRVVLALLGAFTTQDHLRNVFNEFPDLLFFTAVSINLVFWAKNSFPDSPGFLKYHLAINAVNYFVYISWFACEITLGISYTAVVITFAVIVVVINIHIIIMVIHLLVITRGQTSQEWNQFQRTYRIGYMVLCASLLVKITMLLFVSLRYANFFIALKPGDDTSDVHPVPAPLHFTYYIVGELLPAILILLIFERMPSARLGTRFNEYQRLIPDGALKEEPKGKAHGGSGKFVEKYTCKVCWEKEINVVTIPCNHSMLCYECAEKVTQCPICRMDVEEVLKYFPG